MEQVLITGATGLVGRQLLACLLERGIHIFALLRPGSKAKHQTHIQRLDAMATPSLSTLTWIEGDIAQSGLGLTKTLPWATLGHVFHLAALYDLQADAAALERANVGGTRELLGLLRAGGFQGILHHMSSIAVAGNHKGILSEDQLDVGQSHPHPYHASKFAAEQLVHQQTDIRYRIYRPGAIVGHSQTGEMDRVDGPYYLFHTIRMLRDTLPRWFPLYSNRKLRLHMVPVDFVAAAVDALAFLDGLDGQTFHVVDPQAPRFDETYNLLADAAGAPRIRGRGLLRYVPLEWTEQLGSMHFFREKILQDLEIPLEVLDALNADVTFDSSRLQAALRGQGIPCPSQKSYIPQIWDYWLRHLDPTQHPQRRQKQVFTDKKVLITGASSGIGAVLAARCAALGAHVILVARREAELQDVVHQIQEEGGQADYLVADLSTLEACDALIADVLGKHGYIDILVNNAARSIRRPLLESLERFHDFERVMQLNYFAPLRLIRGFLPKMRERGYGHIVNVLTAGIVLPTPRFGAYGSSKAALSHVTDTMGVELMEDNIHFSGIFMPWVRTPMMDATGHYEETKALTPAEAADWIIEAIVEQKPHVMDTETTRRWLVNALAPRTLSRILQVLLRIYHDDESAHPEFALDRQLLKRWIKGKLF